MIRTSLALLLLLESVAATAPSLVAARASSSPRIDGRLDDAAWSAAAVSSTLVQNYPKEGASPSEATEIRVLYDSDALYIGVRCEDRSAQDIIARLSLRNLDVAGDKVTVDVSSRNDNATAYHFQVSAAGALVDGIRFNDTELSLDWDGLWYAATSRDENGWSAELAIPFETLRFAGDVSSFGLQIRRHIARRQEIDEWSYIPRTDRGEVSRYGRLEGIAGVGAKRLFHVAPYVAPGVTWRRRQAPFDGTSFDGNAGADLELGLSSDLTLHATFNPDFATIEVDPVVLNLTTIETYYPEKRPFFLDGADLFATPMKLFYSRRIGAEPPSPTVAADEQLDSALPAGRIWGATTLIGAIGPRLSLGIVEAVTARRDATLRDAAGATRDVLVDALSSFSVLRLKQEFGRNSSFGILGTAVRRFEPDNAAAPRASDLCPVPYTTTFTTLDAPPPRDGRCTNDAYTGGADLALRSDDGEYAVSAQVVGSVVTNGPTRRLPDGVEIGSGDGGLGVVAQVGRYGGEHWLYNVVYGNATPRFQINDVGYLDQANFHDVAASLTLRTTKPTRWYQSAAIETYFEGRRDFALRDNLLFDPELRPRIELPSFWSVSLSLCPYFPRWVENRETQDGARTQREGGFYYSANLKSDPNKLVVFELGGSVFKVHDGLTSLHGSASIAIRPIPALELDVLPSVSRATNGLRWVETADNGTDRTYYFAPLHARTLDLRLRAIYAFSTTLTLQLYMQPFVAAGRYGNNLREVTASGRDPLLDAFEVSTAPVTPGDFSQASMNVNLFVRWEYRPRSTLWLAYIRSQERPAYTSADGTPRLQLAPAFDGPVTDELQLKLSHLF